MNHQSSEVIASKVRDGVVYRVSLMSFARRLELMKRVRGILPRLECFRAGTSLNDKLEAQMLSAEIDRLYVEWGLLEVQGLEIDGVSATPASLADAGPEELFFEALSYVKKACHLVETEAKN